MSTYSNGDNFIFLGDWNSFPSHYPCPRDQANSIVSNSFGNHLADFLHTHDLDAPDIASTCGPCYSFRTSVNRSYIDHVFTPQGSSLQVNNCFVHQDDGLNTSDHLPVSLVLESSSSGFLFGPLTKQLVLRMIILPV